MDTGNPRYARYPILNVKNIVFSLVGRTDMERYVVANITQSKLNVTQRANDLGTLYDRRMGPINDLERCETCQQVLRNCPGHYGKIEFTLPMVHPEYGKVYVHLLSCFCNCMIPDEDNPGKERMCMSPLVTADTIRRFENLSALKKFRRVAAVQRKMCSQFGISHKQGTWLYYTDKDPRAGTTPFRLILRRKNEEDKLMNPARVQEWVAKHVR